jgi:hypothetical protein
MRAGSDGEAGVFRFASLVEKKAGPPRRIAAEERPGWLDGVS